MIEKMFLLNVVGHIDDLDKLSKNIVLSSCIEPLSAIDEISSMNFSVSTKEENKDTILDLSYIKPYSTSNEFNNSFKAMKLIKENNPLKSSSAINKKNLIYNAEELNSEIKTLNGKFTTIFNELSKEIQHRDELAQDIEYLKLIGDLSIPLSDLNNLKNFDFKLYKIPKEDLLKIRGNDENIPAIVLKGLSNKDFEIVMVFVPKILKNNSDRIFNSLHPQKITLPNYNDTAKNTISFLKKEIANIEKEISKLKNELTNFYKNNKETINKLDKSLELQLKSEEIKKYTGVTKDFFYLCGWIPETCISTFKKEISSFSDRLIIVTKSPESANNKDSIPPTKLKNNSLFRPFESMVNMYGVPSYNELDPTIFFAITYTIMFGAMFGDLGQGLVFVALGLYLTNKLKRPNFGGVLTRLGISSSIFGLIYGSFFGFEDVLPFHVIRPMENITQVLVYAIVFGCTLLTLGFIFSLVNNIKRKNIEEGLFGKDGLTGFVLYLSLLGFAVTKFLGIDVMPNAAWIILFVVLLAIILLKQPLANLVKKDTPLYKDNKADYFVENGFGVVETLLSLFSNTVSFIRVGAFAINHVGLFIAFSALANMMNNSGGKISMYILGNLIIIGLEGLIVFIQGLRLEFYELFGKYFEGEGKPFEPVKLSGNIVNYNK